MDNDNGWIKLHRKITEWEWYSDGNTFRMFVHLLLTANHDSKPYQGKTIKRGQRLTTIRRLANELYIDEKTVQRCLQNLKLTKEIKVETSKMGTLITIRKYDDYQDVASNIVGIIPTEPPTPAPTQDTTQPPTEPTTQPPTKQECKNEKNNKNNINTLSLRAREDGKYAPLNANDIAFADFYKNTFGTEFLWNETTSEGVQRLVDCINDKIVEGGGESNPAEMPKHITAFLEAVHRLGDNWINQRLTPQLIAKQFNQLYNQITNGSKHTASYRKGRADNPTGVSAEYIAKIAEELGGGI
ncbi:MAG: hypothetical protein K6G25_06220 [Bacteroidales bacterium]|nr:hypothetical protein [Bacteroidales bacterium]